MENHGISSKFSYVSVSTDKIVILSHPSGKKFHFPTIFNGTFDVQQPGIVEPPTPAKTMHVEEINVQLSFKLLRGSNDPNISQFIVTGGV